MAGINIGAHLNTALSVLFPDLLISYTSRGNFLLRRSVLHLLIGRSRDLSCDARLLI